MKHWLVGLSLVLGVFFTQCLIGAPSRLSHPDSMHTNPTEQSSVVQSPALGQARHRRLVIHDGPDPPTPQQAPARRLPPCRAGLLCSVPAADRTSGRNQQDSKPSISHEGLLFNKITEIFR